MHLKNFFRKNKKEYKAIEMALEIDKGPFSTEKLIDELYSGLMSEQTDQMNIKNIIKWNWILSSDCIYK